MNAGPNHYELLGLAADATDEDIRRAYRARAKTAHPDAGGDPAVFRQLLIAYETLRRPDRRRDYDDANGIRVTPPPPVDGGGRDAAWEGRQGEFSGDVSFPAWMRGITDEQWIPAPPDESALEDPERVAAEKAAARDRVVERQAEVAWWWPDRTIGAPTVVGDDLVLGAPRALVTLAVGNGHETWRLPFERALVGPPVVLDDTAVVWTDDGELHAVDRSAARTRWSLPFGPPAPGAMVAADVRRAGPLLFASRADARLAALRVADGGVAWVVKLAAPASQPPAIDGETLVVVSGGRTVEAIDARTGKHRWRIHLRHIVPLPPRILGYSVWLAGGGQAGALVRLDLATGAVEASFSAGDAIGGLMTDGRSVFATAAGPARMLALDEYGRVDLAVATQRVCAEPTVTPSYAYLADPAGRILAVDRTRQRVAAISNVLFEPVGPPLLAGRHLATVARDGHLWAITRPEEQLAPG